MSVFSTVEGIPISEIKDSVKAEVTDEGAISQETTTFLNKKAVMRIEEDETRVPLGLVATNRLLLHHSDLLDWVHEGLDKTNIDYKVIDNVVNQRSDLFQQYLLNIDMDTPDGESISPSLILKASYVGKPLEIMFGTYRFVCSNGAIVGNTLENFTVKPNQLSDLLNRSIETEILHGVENMSRVSNRYARMAQEPMSDYLPSLIEEKRLSTKIRKEILYSLEKSGQVSLPLEDDDIQIDAESLNHSDPTSLYTLLVDNSAWDLYNVATNIATHTTRTVSGRQSADRQIANIFSV